MLTHTPGPWVVEGWNISAGRKLIGEIFQSDGVRQPELDANAALIAAAPDLLSALVECIEYIDGLKDLKVTFDIDEARAAVSKARGEA